MDGTTGEGQACAGGPRSWRAVAAAVALAALLAHAPALHGTKFTFDDHPIVELNPRLVVRAPADLWSLVTTSYWGDVYRDERLWRPLVLASFALDRALLGPGPDGFHRVSVLLHVLCSLAVLGLYARLGVPRSVAALGAVLFAVHPVHAEAVAGVVGRAEVLALLLAVAGTLAHLRARGPAVSAPRAAAWVLLAAACFFLAFTAKEIALTAPFVLVLVERVAPGAAATRARALLPYAAYAAAIAAYFACRAAVLGDLVPTARAQTIGVLPLSTRALVAAEVARDALGLLAWPQPTSAHYPFRPPSLADPAVVLTVLAHGLALAGGAACHLRRGRAARALGLATWGYYLSLGPVSNIVPIGVVIAERLLYTPSLYTCLGLGVLLGRALGWLRGRGQPGGTGRALAVAAVALVVAGWTLRLQENARAWTDDRRLWAGTLARFPGEGRSHLALGELLLDEGRVDEALAHLRAAVAAIPPGQGQASKSRARLAEALRATGDEAGALQLLAEARALDPGSVPAALALARLHLERAAAAADPTARERELAQAERVAREAARFGAHDHDVWLLWGTILTFVPGREREAEAAFDQAAARRPDPWQACFNRGRVRLGLRAQALAGGGAAAEEVARLEDAALADFREVVRVLLPAARRTDEQAEVLPEALLCVGTLALGRGDPAESEAALLALARVAPDYRPAAREALLAQARRGRVSVPD